MVDGLNLRSDFDFDPQFFVEFALQAILEGLAGVAFAAGELPEAAEVVAMASLREEELSVAEDQAGSDFNDSFHGRGGSGAGTGGRQRPMLL
jgi:hypothetical protein